MSGHDEGDCSRQSAEDGDAPSPSLTLLHVTHPLSKKILATPLQCILINKLWTSLAIRFDSTG